MSETSDIWNIIKFTGLIFQNFDLLIEMEMIQ